MPKIMKSVGFKGGSIYIYIYIHIHIHIFILALSEATLLGAGWMVHVRHVVVSGHTLALSDAADRTEARPASSLTFFEDDQVLEAYNRSRKGKIMVF